MRQHGENHLVSEDRHAPPPIARIYRQDNHIRILPQRQTQPDLRKIKEGRETTVSPVFGRMRAPNGMFGGAHGATWKPPRAAASAIRLPNLDRFFSNLFIPQDISLTLTAQVPILHLASWGASKIMDYKIGDKVVYPNHGVGIVEQINYGVLNGRTERYYMIRIVSSGLRVMVPQSNAGTVGLRSVIRSNESIKVLGFLEKGKLNSHPDWKHRFKENSERMRTGSLIEVAAVLKSLVSLSRSKPLSFREKKMLERAKYLLVSEMATAKNTTAELAEVLVVKSLAKAKLQFPIMTEKFE